MRSLGLEVVKEMRKAGDFQFIDGLQNFQLEWMALGGMDGQYFDGIIHWCFFSSRVVNRQVRVK